MEEGSLYLATSESPPHSSSTTVTEVDMIGLSVPAMSHQIMAPTRYARISDDNVNHQSKLASRPYPMVTPPNGISITPMVQNTVCVPPLCASLTQPSVFFNRRRRHRFQSCRLARRYPQRRSPAPTSDGPAHRVTPSPMSTVGVGDTPTRRQVGDRRSATSAVGVPGVAEASAQ